MKQWSALRLQPGHLSIVTAAILTLAAVLASARALPQAPAPYGLFPRRDCELTSAYSAATRRTVVQLALTPPGLAGTPSAASLVLRAEYAGREPSTPPADVEVLALPAVTSNPTLIRGVELELTVEHAGEKPVRFFYPGRSWGDYGFVPPGGEITRVGFTIPAVELKALLVADRITGRVMNATLTLTGRELEALHRFGAAIGLAVSPPPH